MAKRLVWVGADGVSWHLSGAGVRGVILEDNGFGDAVGGYDGNSKTPKPIEFEMTLAFTSDSKYGHHGEPSRIFNEFCEGCSSRVPGLLVIEDTEREQVSLPCLVTKLPVMARPNMRSGAFRGVFRFSSKGGVWRARRHDNANNVTVTNSGDVMVWPKILWKGAGGKITAPSGASFNLPEAKEWRMLNLDPATSCEVTDLRGILDPSLWKKLWGVFGEGVPVSESRMYQLPAGAELTWELGFFNPWR